MTVKAALNCRTREEFQQLYNEEVLPLPKRWHFDVVAITAGTEVRRLSA